MKYQKLKFITEAGVFLALGLVFLSIKIYQLPNGGSVSIAILPLLILSARWGLVYGLVACTLFGVLAAIYKPFIVHPVQFLLDYPLAYMSICLVGAMSWENNLKFVVIGVVISNILRLVFHVISGIIFFSMNEKTLLAAFIYSFSYNISHILPETIIALLFSVLIAKKYSFLIQRQEK